MLRERKRIKIGLLCAFNFLTIANAVFSNCDTTYVIISVQSDMCLTGLSCIRLLTVFSACFRNLKDQLISSLLDVSATSTYDLELLQQFFIYTKRNQSIQIFNIQFKDPHIIFIKKKLFISLKCF